MKISVTKKLLIFCLSLMLAVAAAVFTVLQINNNAYAEVAPDGVTSYADGEGEEGGEERVPVSSGDSSEAGKPALWGLLGAGV